MLSGFFVDFFTREGKTSEKFQSTFHNSQNFSEQSYLFFFCISRSFDLSFSALWRKCFLTFQNDMRHYSQYLILMAFTSVSKINKFQIQYFPLK